MWVIRTILALLFAALIILIDLPLHVITWLIEKASPGSCTKFRHAYARFGMKGIWFLAGGKATVIGEGDLVSGGWKGDRDRSRKGSDGQAGAVCRKPPQYL